MIRFQVWTFLDYVNETGTNPVNSWYEDLSPSAQVQFDTLLKDACKVEDPRNWVCFKRFLQGKKYKSEKIWELAFVADRRQHRILGKFGTKRRQAILLCGCYHKQNVYEPAKALDTAYKRSKALSEGKGSLYERKIKEDI